MLTPKAISAALLILIAWRLIPRNVSNDEYNSHLKDKVVLITDAGSELGTELAYKLASHGAKLLLVFSLSGREKMLKALSEGSNADPKERGMLTRARNKRIALKEKALSLGSPQVEVLSHDYGNITETHTLIDVSIEELGALDYLVMTHEEVVRGSKHTADVLTRSLNVNVLSHIELVRTATPHLEKSGDGHVFILSSILGEVHSTALPVYSASKHALNTFFYAIKQELEESGVTMTIGQLGEISTTDRQPLYNIPQFMRGDAVNGAEYIAQSLITRPPTLYYPKLHCVLARAMSFFVY